MSRISAALLSTVAVLSTILFLYVLDRYPEQAVLITMVTLSVGFAVLFYLLLRDGRW